tara:strand:+ start:584 stop:778 length:195 start_codon:yes stop_codon:yes gene_type:complete
MAQWKNLEDKSFDEVCTDMKELIDKINLAFYDDKGTDTARLNMYLKLAQTKFTTVKTHAKLTAF